MVSHLRFVRAFRVIDVHKGLFKQAWLMAREPKGEEHGGGKLLWRHAEPKRRKDKQSLQPGEEKSMQLMLPWNFLVACWYKLWPHERGLRILVSYPFTPGFFLHFFQIITRAVDSRPGEFNWQGGVCKESSICLFTFLSIFTPYKKSSQRA